MDIRGAAEKAHNRERSERLVQFKESREHTERALVIRQKYNMDELARMIDYKGIDRPDGGRSAEGPEINLLITIFYSLRPNLVNLYL